MGELASGRALPLPVGGPGPRGEAGTWLPRVTLMETVMRLFQMRVRL